jgi:hypothetical protein
MLVELCVGNYATYDGLVNITSTTYCDKTIIWIMFESSKIGTLTKIKNKIIITTITLNQNGHQLNLSSMI